MGRLVLREVLEADDLWLSAAVTYREDPNFNVDAATVAGLGSGSIPITATAPECFGDADVIIDFSTPDSLKNALSYVENRALVSGTTGLDAGLRDILIDQANIAPVLTASNFSTGIAVLLDFARKAAAALPDYDIEIIEAHHHHKADAPSGTALSLAEAAARGRKVRLSEVMEHGREGITGPRKTGNIGMHAVRMGDVIGDHDVWLAGGGERIRLGHVATDRTVFAKGAVRAARWISGRSSGRYTMAQVLGLS